MMYQFLSARMFSTNFHPTWAKTLSRGLTALIAVTLLSSCSRIGVLQDRSDDYRRTEEFERLRVPEGLDDVAIGELFPIPEGGEVLSYQLDDDFTAPRPDNSVSQTNEEVKIQRLGEEVWILVGAPPSEAWPRVRSYLTRSGIPSARADASRGVIETDLFQLSDSPDEFQQFKVTLSQGVQVNTTEIEILQRSFFADELPKELPDWRDFSDSVFREDWLRDGLASDLAVASEVGTASMMGQEIGAETKVKLVTPEQDVPYIEMKLNPQRAWASISYAFERYPFEVVEKDSEAGYLIAAYNDKGSKKKRSLIRRALSFGRKQEQQGGKDYRFSTIDKKDHIQIRATNLDGSELTQREAYLLLQAVRSNLG